MNTKRSVDAEARAWIARLKSGEATSEDASAFLAWRQRSAAHEDALRRALRLWEISGAATAAEPARPLSRRGFLLGAGGLSVAAGAYQAAVFLGHAPSLRALTADHATAVGVRAALEVEGMDGAIDGASAISADGTEGLQLLQGALFVAVDPVARGARPLRLGARALEASLRTGAAELRLGDRGAEIACAEGEVEVVAPAPMRLAAGETLAVLDGGAVARTRQAPDDIAGWRHGILTFRNRRLGDALADLNRHRTGKVLLGNALLAERQVSGVFHLDRPDEIVALLVESLGIQRRDLPGRLVILS